MFRSYTAMELCEVELIYRCFVQLTSWKSNALVSFYSLQQMTNRCDLQVPLHLLEGLQKLRDKINILSFTRSLTSLKVMTSCWKWLLAHYYLGVVRALRGGSSHWDVVAVTASGWRQLQRVAVLGRVLEVQPKHLLWRLKHVTLCALLGCFLTWRTFERLTATCSKRTRI